MVEFLHTTGNGLRSLVVWWANNIDMLHTQGQPAFIAERTEEEVGAQNLHM